MWTDRSPSLLLKSRIETLSSFSLPTPSPVDIFHKPRSNKMDLSEMFPKKSTEYEILLLFRNFNQIPKLVKIVENNTLFLQHFVSSFINFVVFTEHIYFQNWYRHL